jgi:hypothetical protein
MKKTLMALAVGAAFVAPAALADVTISGAINMVSPTSILTTGPTTATVARTSS